MYVSLIVSLGKLLAILRWRINQRRKEYKITLAPQIQKFDTGVIWLVSLLSPFLHLTFFFLILKYNMHHIKSWCYVNTVKPSLRFQLFSFAYSFLKKAPSPRGSGNVIGVLYAWCLGAHTLAWVSSIKLNYLNLNSSFKSLPAQHPSAWKIFFISVCELANLIAYSHCFWSVAYLY